MKRSRLILILLALTLTLSLAVCSCGKKVVDADTSETESTPTVTEKSPAKNETETSASKYADISVDGIPLSDYKLYVSGTPGALSDRVRIAVLNSIGTAPMSVAEADGTRIELILDSELEENYYRIKSGDGVIRLESDTDTGLSECIRIFEEELASKSTAGTAQNISFSKSGAYATPFASLEDYSGAYFYSDTDKSALSYKIGEEMNMTVYLSTGTDLASCAQFAWTMKGDDGKTSEGFAPGINGSVSFKTTLDTNGFVMITVKALDATGKEINENVRFSGAMGVHPELVTQTHEEPSDFDAFWEKAIADMNAVTPEIIEMKEVSAQGGFKAYKMKVACVGNDKWTGETYVSGYLSYPEGASAGSLKMRATFQGYGVSSPSVSCSDGYITFAVCGHSIEVGEDSTYYTDLASGALKGHGWYATDNADPNEVYFKYMLLRDLQALRFMKQYFGSDGNGLWDGKTITLSGASQGGFQVIALAALDSDVTSVNAGVPWLCDIGGYTDGKKIKSSFQPEYCDSIRYFDTANFAKRVKCPVSISAGLGDPLCPPAGVAAMYNSLTCPRTLVFKQGGTHSYTQPNGELFEFSGGTN